MVLLSQLGQFACLFIAGCEKEDHQQDCDDTDRNVINAAGYALRRAQSQGKGVLAHKEHKGIQRDGDQAQFCRSQFAVGDLKLSGYVRAYVYEHRKQQISDQTDAGIIEIDIRSEP